MSSSQPTTIEREFPVIHADRFRALLSESGVSYTEDRGFVLRKFVITASAEQAAQLLPKLEAWESDMVSRDAW